MRVRRAAAWLAGVVAVGAVALVGWYRLSYLPPRLSLADPAALAALRPDAGVQVTDGGAIWLAPTTSGAPRAGFIFYPGGEVEAEGYAEPLRAVAAAGHPVAIVRMPLHLAVLAPDRAESVIAGHPEISRWVIGGHSLGGAMAARFVATHPGRVSGLLLWDSYPAPENDLAAATLPVMQLFRTGPDGTAPDAYRDAARLLPPQTELVPLPGASHMNYGRFVVSRRVREMGGSFATATMPIGEQHRRIVAATISFLDAFDGKEH